MYKRVSKYFQEKKWLFFSICSLISIKNKIKELRSFAKGLKKDLDAVENVVTYDYSNDFVEETSSRLKMIKRTMYEKYYKELLEAKLCYMRQVKNG